MMLTIPILIMIYEGRSFTDSIKKGATTPVPWLYTIFSIFYFIHSILSLYMCSIMVD